MNRKRIFLGTVYAWIAIRLTYQAFRIWVVLSGPPDPDTYANTLSFQLVASAFLVVVLWFPILAAVLFLELLVFSIGDRLRAVRSGKRDVPAA